MSAQPPTQQGRTRRVFSSVFMVSKHTVTHLYNSATYTDDQIPEHCVAKKEKKKENVYSKPAVSEESAGVNHPDSE